MKNRSLAAILLLALAAGCAPVTSVRRWMSGQSLVDKTRGASVEVRISDGKTVGIGSGAVIDAAHGLVLTNHHVVSNGLVDGKSLDASKVQIFVCTDADTDKVSCLKATLVTSSPKHDLALLKAERALPGEVRFAEPRALEEGEEVFARVGIAGIIGPVLVYGRYAGTATPATGRFDKPLLLFDVFAGSGGSGGPIFDRKRGELLGLTVSVTGPIGRGLTVAIPAAEIRDFLMEAAPLIGR